MRINRTWLKRSMALTLVSATGASLIVAGAMAWDNPTAPPMSATPPDPPHPMKPGGAYYTSPNAPQFPMNPVPQFGEGRQPGTQDGYFPVPSHVGPKVTRIVPTYDSQGRMVREVRIDSIPAVPGFVLEEQRLIQLYHRTTDSVQKEEQRKELVKHLEKQFDASIEKAQQELKQLEDRLQTARENLDKRIAKREAIVGFRAKSLLGERDELDWDYSVDGVANPSANRVEYHPQPAQAPFPGYRTPPVMSGSVPSLPAETGTPALVSEGPLHKILEISKSIDENPDDGDENPELIKLLERYQTQVKRLVANWQFINQKDSPAAARALIVDALEKEVIAIQEEANTTAEKSPVPNELILQIHRGCDETLKLLIFLEVQTAD